MMCFTTLEDFCLFVSLRFSLKLQIMVVLEVEALSPSVIHPRGKAGGPGEKDGPQRCKFLGQGAGILFGRGSALPITQP